MQPNFPHVRLYLFWTIFDELVCRSVLSRYLALMVAVWQAGSLPVTAMAV